MLKKNTTDAVHLDPAAEPADGLLALTASPAKCLRGHTVTGYRRDYLGNRFVYVTVSPRARGLSVGVNLSLDKRCNFACIYCDVDRTPPIHEEVLASTFGAT